MKNKRILMVIVSSLAAVALIVLAVLLLTTKTSRVQLTDDGQPAILYRKLVNFEDERAVYNLYFCGVGGQPQLLESGVRHVEVGNDGQLVGFNFRSDDYIKTNVFLMDSSGLKRPFEKGVFGYEIMENGYAIIYRLTDSRDILYMREYTETGQIQNEEAITVGDGEYNDEANLNAGMVAIVKNMRSGQEDWSGDEDDNPYAFNWGDLYIYSDGAMELIAEKTFLSGLGQSIADNGTLVYLAESNSETKTGTLYIKEAGSAPRAIVSNATTRFAISRDGSLVAALTGNEIDGYKMFYQYVNGTAGTINDADQFKINNSGNTLFYTVPGEEEWHSQLYRVNENAETELLADEASLLVDVSDDGNTVLYIANYDPDTEAGDLCVLRQGRDAELVDTEVMITYWAAFLGSDTLIMSDDGSTIAYLKNIDTNWLYGDLYVKNMDEPVQLMDDHVSVGFYFFG